jgi:ribosomal protein S18 acetylase RimI-like enzyme
MDNGWLVPFQPSHAVEISGWATSAEEASQWAGSGCPFPVDAARFAVWHADPDIQPYVLYADGVLIGYGEVWADSDEQEVELARLIVKPAHRGRGIGRQLVALLLEQAQATGYPDAFVRVVPENAAAIACYRRAEFLPVSAVEQQQFNQGQPVEYLWMQRELNPL